MRFIRRLGFVLAIGVVASACATLTAKRDRIAFKKWPSRPPDCDFDVFEEDFEPQRPYEVRGASRDGVPGRGAGRPAVASP